MYVRCSECLLDNIYPQKGAEKLNIILSQYLKPYDFQVHLKAYKVI